MGSANFRKTEAVKPSGLGGMSAQPNTADLVKELDAMNIGRKAARESTMAMPKKNDNVQMPNIMA